MSSLLLLRCTAPRMLSKVILYVCMCDGVQPCAVQPHHRIAGRSNMQSEEIKNCIKIKYKAAVDKLIWQHDSTTHVCRYRVCV